MATVTTTTGGSTGDNHQIVAGGVGVGVSLVQIKRYTQSHGRSSGVLKTRLVYVEELNAKNESALERLGLSPLCVYNGFSFSP